MWFMLSIASGDGLVGDGGRIDRETMVLLDRNVLHYVIN